MAKSDLKLGPLMFDLMGPFVVHFCNNQVRISAPLCADHFANILTDSNDIPLDGLPTPAFAGCTYNLELKLGPRMPGTACTISPNVLVVDKKCEVAIPQQTTHLLMTAPAPDQILGLQEDGIWIQKNGATAWINKNKSKDPNVTDDENVARAPRARGLRFIYNCLDTPKITVPPSGVARMASADYLEDINPKVIGPGSLRYSIVLHFASNRRTLDEHNQDAISCFQTVRNLVADTANWQVLFNDSQTIAGKNEKSIFTVVAGHPVHCTGASLVTSNTGTKAEDDGTVKIPFIGIEPSAGRKRSHLR